jgi:hypothetical protein
MMQNGSSLENLWGANLYPRHPVEQRIEYTALINIRPHQGNPGMEIQNEQIKQKVKILIEKMILSPDENLV